MHTRRKIIKLTLLLTAAAQRRSMGQVMPQVRNRRFSVPLVDDSGAIVSRYNASANYLVEDLGAGFSLDLTLVPGGTFQMGSASSPGHPEESPTHNVQVRPFALGTNPITIGQWRQVATLPRVSTDLHLPARAPIPLDAENSLPIDFVSAAETREFCARLQKLTGRNYRLPSEAEWEYACRAGTLTKYHFGEGISLDVANYNDGIKRPISLTPVGSKQAPNRFGLNDMHGNVLEWCSDSFHNSYVGSPNDGSSWIDSGSSSRVTRGGCFLFGADFARSSARFRWDTRENAGSLGLRVAVDLASGSTDPVLGSSGIVNVASQLAGPPALPPGATPTVAPGEIVSIPGRFGISNSASMTLDDQGIALTSLLGVRVLFNDFPAPLLLVSDAEIRAVVPYNIAGLSSVWVAVESQGQTSLPLLVDVVDASPGIFTMDSLGTGQAAAVNQDGTLNGPTNPVPTGMIITLFATGEGQTSPPGVNGKIATAPLPTPVLDAQLWIGGIRAEIDYVGAAPGEITGLLQINARVPAALSSGPASVELRVGQATSRSVLIAVA